MKSIKLLEEKKMRLLAPRKPAANEHHFWLSETSSWEESDKITCRLESSSSYMVIIVDFPESVPEADRASTFRWLKSYRDRVKNENPFWTCRLAAAAERYSLFIAPARDAKGLLQNSLNSYFDAASEPYEHPR